MKTKNGSKGFFKPRLIKTISFYLITACLIMAVILSILAIWDFADSDTFWRMISTLGVIALGSAIFSFVNGIFGEQL